MRSIPKRAGFLGSMFSKALDDRIEELTRVWKSYIMSSEKKDTQKSVQIVHVKSTITVTLDRLELNQIFLNYLKHCSQN